MQWKPHVQPERAETLVSTPVAHPNPISPLPSECIYRCLLLGRIINRSSLCSCPHCRWSFHWQSLLPAADHRSFFYSLGSSRSLLWLLEPSGCVALNCRTTPGLTRLSPPHRNGPNFIHSPPKPIHTQSKDPKTHQSYKSNTLFDLLIPKTGRGLWFLLI